ncbi:tetraspanin-3-like [Paramacrobiotus metropolitanus]|uniref:tetraspanin-3-like n=1 Tax=Paramacrobiotus metropolitanus TaxID=2943436 RepID=UPI002445DAB0|nr:tetraspanin-3-like [Paramacrobiotus metropolitanus]
MDAYRTGRDAATGSRIVAAANFNDLAENVEAPSPNQHPQQANVMPISHKIFKTAILVISGLYLGVGILFIAGGVIIWNERLFNVDHFEFVDLQSITDNVIGLAITVGALTLVVAALGLPAGSCRNRYAILSFGVALIVLMVFQLVCLGLGFSGKHQMETQLTDDLWHDIAHYNESNHHKIDKVQRELCCCGVDSFGDWLDSGQPATMSVSARKRKPNTFNGYLPKTGKFMKVAVSFNVTVSGIPHRYPPLSCCNLVDETLCIFDVETVYACAQSDQNNNCDFYTRGCAPLLRDTLREMMGIIGAVAAVLLFLDIAGIICAAWLFCRLYRIAGPLFAFRRLDNIREIDQREDHHGAASETR